MIRFALILLALFLLDWYAYQAVRVVSSNLSTVQKQFVFWCYWILFALAIGIIISGRIVDWHQWPKPLRVYSFAFVFIWFFCKLFIIIFLLIDDITRFFRWIASLIQRKFFTSASETVIPGKGITRAAFLSKLGIFIAAVPFVSLIYGMVKGVYDYRVHKIKLKVPNLPHGFDGLKVIQISDIHSGSFLSPEPLQRAVKMITDMQADLIFFTGDLVNDKATEAQPYIDIFKKITAPLGVYSIFGNHDYGDYMHWDSTQEKAANLESLKRTHAEIGWRLLLDEHVHITRNDEKITVIGVQNWSNRMRFQQYGDLVKATQNIEYSDFNILLSHDPSHWNAQVTKEYPQIDLTLSGHTHGMQFGIEIPGFKWSPVQYVYKQWADLYKEGNQYLYVNRGLGFLAYPGRVGILPEITLFELQRG